MIRTNVLGLAICLASLGYQEGAGAAEHEFSVDVFASTTHTNAAPAVAEAPAWWTLFGLGAMYATGPILAGVSVESGAPEGLHSGTWGNEFASVSGGVTHHLSDWFRADLTAELGIHWFVQTGWGTESQQRYYAGLTPALRLSLGGTARAELSLAVPVRCDFGTTRSREGDVLGGITFGPRLGFGLQLR